MLFTSTSAIPPGGWRFRQPETNWPSQAEMANMRLGFTYDQWIDAIIKHRLANPRFKLSTDPATVGGELQLQTALGLRSNKAARSYFATEQKGPIPKSAAPPSPMSGSIGAAAGAVASKVRKIHAGAKTIYDWLGEGGIPVAQVEADRRAVICETCTSVSRNTLNRRVPTGTL